MEISFPIFCRFIVFLIVLSTLCQYSSQTEEKSNDVPQQKQQPLFIHKHDTTDGCIYRTFFVFSAYSEGSSSDLLLSVDRILDAMPKCTFIYIVDGMSPSTRYLDELTLKYTNKINQTLYFLHNEEKANGYRYEFGNWRCFLRSVHLYDNDAYFLLQDTMMFVKELSKEFVLSTEFACINFFDASGLEVYQHNYRTTAIKVIETLNSSIIEVPAAYHGWTLPRGTFCGCLGPNFFVKGSLLKTWVQLGLFELKITTKSDAEMTERLVAVAAHGTKSIANKGTICGSIDGYMYSLPCIHQWLASSVRLQLSVDANRFFAKNWGTGTHNEDSDPSASLARCRQHALSLGFRR